MVRYSSKATFDELILWPLLSITKGINFKLQFHKDSILSIQTVQKKVNTDVLRLKVNTSVAC
jgi:hypothetical protein